MPRYEQNPMQCFLVDAHLNNVMERPGTLISHWVSCVGVPLPACDFWFCQHKKRHGRRRIRIFTCWLQQGDSDESTRFVGVQCYVVLRYRERGGFSKVQPANAPMANLIPAFQCACLSVKVCMLSTAGVGRVGLCR